MTDADARRKRDRQREERVERVEREVAKGQVKVEFPIGSQSKSRGRNRRTCSALDRGASPISVQLLFLYIYLVLDSWAHLSRWWASMTTQTNIVRFRPFRWN